MATGNYVLPPPHSLEIHDPQAAEKWKKFKRAWANYALATGLNEKDEAVQVATLLTVIGEEAREVFSTFTGWTAEGDEAKIEPVLAKFEKYCQPHKNIPFERYKFNRRSQEPGETYDQYRTALRKLGESCDFQSITPDEILRDRLVFGISDSKVRERLLRESKLTLTKTDEICRASESMMLHMKIVEESPSAAVNAVKTASGKEQTTPAEPEKPVYRECWNCGYRHGHKKELCPAFGKHCNKCNRRNHFAAKCRSKKATRVVKALEEDESSEVFLVKTELDDSQCVTLKLESGNYLRFQVDTGAQCNVVPLVLYKKATRDYCLKKVTPAKQNITAYGGTTIPVCGSTRLRVWRGDYRCKLDCKVVDRDDIRPILGRKACIGMRIVAYLDNDNLNKPHPGRALVYAVDNKHTPMSKDSVIKKYPTVFGAGVGLLDGEYRIRIDPQASAVQHAPRRVPVAIREQLQATLEELTQQDIITPVTQPTPWISSLVVVPKKDGRLRLCLDPQDLNKAIKREHYPLPTIEEIATRLHGAKLFTILDVRHGFWHVSLDEQSSLLTTFNTPFGRYRWKRMPFGISSAPEVFQRKMHEMIEGLEGVEVVADDFVVVGFGSTQDEASKSHDIHLEAFLKRCEEKNLRLNDGKLKLHQTEVPFIGHVATTEGLCVDPHKVQAIVEMPPPTDVAGVQRLLGMAQYLNKFLPHLSDLTKPFRELTHQDSLWTWDQPQKAAFEKLKEAVSNTPVLRYYNLSEEVTLQCDASQSGLGAALLQGGQPVAYASRALTPTETRYAQIEKELLAIVFACDHFEAYVFGRECVNVETDHQPLVSIVTKPLNKAPSRLQRMLLRLQKYSLKLSYKKGSEMYLADTLSRAYLPEVHVCDFTHRLEEVDHTSLLAIPPNRLQKVRQASADDVVLSELRSTIHRGWPEKRSEVSESVLAYYDIRDELVVQDSLVFKGPLLVIPSALRKEMIELIHATHIGIEGCLRRARDLMYWPRMTTQLKDYMSKCDVCMSHRPQQRKELIQQHTFAARPWSKVGADLCELQGRTLLVVSDYYSNFIEVEKISKPNSSGVSKALMGMFARYGVPDTLVTDNGPQFGSEEFRKFSIGWGFEHVTSSPRYPQSNGKAENAVKTVKRLFTKCSESGLSEFRALLDWRNTPSEGMDTSPAQRFLGRRCKTLLPTATSLLKPQYETAKDAQALNRLKEKQKSYYNRHAKPLAPLSPGETVRMQLPGDKTWTPGTCTGQSGPRSYNVRVGDQEYRRNRRQLLQTKEPQEPVLPDVQSTPETSHSEMSESTPQVSAAPEEARPQPRETLSTPVERRQSSRIRKKPDWYSKHVETGHK